MFQGGRGMRLPFDSSKFSHQTVSTTQTPLYYTIARYILIEIHFFIVSTQIGQQLVIPSAGQTLTKLVVFDASSYFLHLCGIDTSSSYIPTFEIILLLLIFDCFTPILQHVRSDRINGGFPLIPPPHLLFFANTLISRKLDIKAFTNHIL